MKKEITGRRKKLLKVVVKKMNSLNKFPLPATKYLYECFSIAMEDDELEFLNRIDSNKEYLYEELFSVAELSDEKFEVFFKRVLNKGFIFCIDENNEKVRYHLSPIMVGWFEIYLSGGKETTDKKLFAEALERYSSSRKFLTHFPIRNIFNILIKSKVQPITEIAEAFPVKKRRTLHLNRKMSSGNFTVLPTGRVYDLIEKYGKSNELAVVYCFCRQWKKMVNQKCIFNHDGETCIIMGRAVNAAMRAGVGRKISTSECLKIIENTAKKGAVHQVFYESLEGFDGEMAICNCCWDCCGIFGSFNRGLMHLCVKANFVAENTMIDSDCINCGRCEHYCPTNAIKITDKKVLLDKNKCIGCGQCRLQCPKNLFVLNKEEREVFIPMLKPGEVRIKN